MNMVSADLIRRMDKSQLKIFAKNISKPSFGRFIDENFDENPDFVRDIAVLAYALTSRPMYNTDAIGIIASRYDKNLIKSILREYFQKDYFSFDLCDKLEAKIKQFKNLAQIKKDLKELQEENIEPLLNDEKIQYVQDFISKNKNVTAETTFGVCEGKLEHFGTCVVTVGNSGFNVLQLEKLTCNETGEILYENPYAGKNLSNVKLVGKTLGIDSAFEEAGEYLDNIEKEDSRFAERYQKESEKPILFKKYFKKALPYIYVGRQEDWRNYLKINLIKGCAFNYSIEVIDTIIEILEMLDNGENIDKVYEYYCENTSGLQKVDVAGSVVLFSKRGVEFFKRLEGKTFDEKKKDYLKYIECQNKQLARADEKYNRLCENVRTVRYRLKNEKMHNKAIDEKIALENFSAMFK